jgi:hypothetical protein
MQDFPDVVAAPMQRLEPAPCNGTKRTRMVVKPLGHGWMAPCRAVESKHLPHHQPTMAA